MSSGREAGIYCEVCKKRFPGASSADVFKHNLTWEHRSNLGAPKTSYGGCGTNGEKQQEQGGAGRKVEGTLSTADTTTGVGNTTNSSHLIGCPVIAKTSSQRPVFHPRPPPSPFNGRPPPARLFPPTRPLFPGPPHFLPPPQQKVIGGWPSLFFPFPPHTPPSRGMPPNQPSVSGNVTRTPTPLFSTPPSASLLNVQPSNAQPAVSSVPPASSQSQACGTQTNFWSTSFANSSSSFPRSQVPQPSKDLTKPLSTFAGVSSAPSSSRPLTTLQSSSTKASSASPQPVFSILPLPANSTPRPLPTANSHSKPAALPLPLPVGRIGGVVLSTLGPGTLAPPKAGSEATNTERSGKDPGTPTVSSSAKEQPELLYGRKLPPMRIPKFSDSVRKAQNQGVSPSISKDGPLSAPKKQPPVSSAGSATPSSLSVSAQSAAQIRKTVSDSPGKKRKKKKKKKKGSQASDAASNAPATNCGTDQVSKKVKQPTKKQKRAKERLEKFKRTVIRDTSPKFIPPEKSKRLGKSQAKGSVVGAEPMARAGSSSNQCPLNSLPCNKKTQTPTSNEHHTKQTESRRRPEAAGLIPTSPPQSLRQPSHTSAPGHRKSSTGEPPVKETEPRSGSCAAQPVRKLPRPSNPVTQPPQPNDPAELRSSSSGEPVTMETESETRPCVTEPARSLAITAPSKSFKPAQQPSPTCKPAPKKLSSVISGPSETEDSSNEQNVSGFVLRLPPSKAKGESLLFGDVIVIESQGGSQSSEMAVDHPAELEEGKIESLGDSSTYPASSATASKDLPFPAGTVSQQTSAPLGTPVSRPPLLGDDTAVTQPNLNTQVESGGRILPITRTSSDGSGGSCSHPNTEVNPRPRFSSLSTEVSGIVEHFAVSGSGAGKQKRSASTSSSANVAPLIPLNQKKPADLPLVLPTTPPAAVKQEPLTPAQSIEEPSPSLIHSAASNPFYLDSDVLQRLQEKIDLEVSKMKLMDLGQIPSNPHGVCGNSIPTLTNPGESEAEVEHASEARLSEPSGFSASATSEELPPNAVQSELHQSGSKVHNESVETCASSTPLNGEIELSNHNALPRPSDSNTLPKGGLLSCKRRQSDSNALPKSPLTTERRPSDPNALPKGSLPLEKGPSDSNAIQKGPLTSEKVPSDPNTLPKVSVPSEKGQSDSNTSANGPVPSEKDSNALPKSPLIPERDPPVPCAKLKNSRGAPLLSTPPKCLKLTQATTPRIPAAAEEGKGVDRTLTPQPEEAEVDFLPLQSTVSAVPEKKPESRSTSPRLDVIINSLKSRKVSSDAPLTDNTSYSLNSATRSSQKKKRRKSSYDDTGVKKLRLETGDSSDAGKKDSVEKSTPAQPSPILQPAMAGSGGDGGDGGLKGESETENMSVSSSQHSSSQGEDPTLMTPHRKFASEIAALDKRDKDLQEKLIEAQSQVDAMSQIVQELESQLAELVQQQRQLTQKRNELTDQYQQILVEKQNLFTSPPKDSDSQDSTATTVTKPNFFAKMKELSEKEQDMQMKLLQGNQLLEEISMKKIKEGKKLEEVKLKKLVTAQSLFSMLKKEYQEVQRKKQEVLRSSWTIPLPASPPREESINIEGILPLQSVSNATPDSSKPVDSPTERISHTMDVETGVWPQSVEDVAMEEITSPVPSLAPDHSAYTQLQLHPLHPSDHHFTNPPLTPSYTILGSPRTRLTPLTPQERLYCSPSHSDSNRKTNTTTAECSSNGANARSIPTAPIANEVDSILFPESVPSTPSDQQEQSVPLSNGIFQSPSVNTATAASAVDDGGNTDSVVVKLENAEYEEKIDDVFMSGDGGMGGSDSEEGGGNIRQAWMATQALISTRAAPAPVFGASRDLPLEVGEEEKGKGMRENLSDMVKEETEEVMEATTAGGEVRQEERVEEDSDGAKLTTEYNPHLNSVLGVKVSSGFLYSCSSDKSVRVYNIMNCQEEKEFKKHRRSITCIEIFTCGGEVYIVSGSTDKHIIMYHSKTGEVEIDFSLGARVQCMVSQGSLLVAGLSNGFIHLLNLQSKAALGKWLVGGDPDKKDISCLCIHQNRLFTASYDNMISCWDISDYLGGAEGFSLTRIHEISSFSSMVLCMQVEGELLYCGSADHTLQIFNTQTWASCGKVRGHNGAISGLCVNGNLLFTSCFDRLIRCFDTRDQILLQVYSIGDLPFTLCSSRDSVYCGLRNGKLISIKIDLSSYHQCQWAGCGLKFGLRHHLKLHMKEHSSDGKDSLVQPKFQLAVSLAMPPPPFPPTSSGNPAHTTTTSGGNKAAYLQTHHELQQLLSSTSPSSSSSSLSQLTTSNLPSTLSSTNSLQI